MYGFILLHLKTTVHGHYGQDGWNKVRLHCGFPDENFKSTQRYPDHYIILIAEAAAEVLRVGADEFFEMAGASFVRFLQESGYKTVLSVLGRSFRDFVRGLNNLHHYVSIKFPEMEAPTFTVGQENEKGLVLHYRSKRRSLVYYLIGILKSAATQLYSKELEVDLLRKDETDDGIHAVLRLSFMNNELKTQSWGLHQGRHRLPITVSTLLHIYPFAVILNKNMRIEYIGSSLSQLVPHVAMEKFTDLFKMENHKSSISFHEVLEKPDIIYNVSVSDVRRNIECRLHLKGQMIHLKAWEMIIFLGTPLIPTLDFVMDIGLFLNDLPMHDFSRDKVLTGTQESSELRLSLETEQEKTAKIREAMRRLDEEVERTNSLLYQMIPQHVTEQLKTSESPMATCTTYGSASILLSDVVKFTEMCSQLKPMQVVTLLNRMYSIFDRLTEKHKVCKIETIGDAYMVVAGLQDEVDHASRVCDMALEITRTVISLKNPNTGEHLQVRVGISTGPIVAGVVGQKMPRYCLFGKTSLLAAVMEHSSEPMKIHLGQHTADQLTSSYILSFRGLCKHPEFTGMRTYWLERKHCQNVPVIVAEDYRGTSYAAYPGVENRMSGEADLGSFSWCFPTSSQNCYQSCFLS